MASFNNAHMNTWLAFCPWQWNPILLFSFSLKISATLWGLISVFLSFFNIYLFWERERETEREPVEEGQRERERERIPSRFHAVNAGLMQGSISRTMRSWPERRSRVGCLIDWASRVPQRSHLFPFEDLILTLYTFTAALSNTELST